MSTPTFVAQDSSTFTTVRLYTATDPYYYVTDNRPLQDIITNLQDARGGGGDAARRAALINALGMSSLQADLYTAPSSSGNSRVMVGLPVSNPSTNVIRIGGGAVFEQRSINDTLSSTVVTKQALFIGTQDFTLTGPVSAGTSIVYTIEGKYNDLTSSQLSTSALPYVDATNNYLPSTLLNGELTLGMVTGTAASTGSEVPAATTAGKYPLYNVTLTQGSSVPKITLHANSPWVKGTNHTILPVALASGGATIGVTNEQPTALFPDSSTTGVMLPVSGTLNTLNPFKPLKLKITFASSASTGSVVVRLRYKGYAIGDLITAALTTGSNETIAVTGAANAVQTYTTATAIVPNTEFAGLVSGVWTINKERLNIILERVGADGADTNTGNLIVVGIALTQ